MNEDEMRGLEIGLDKKKVENPIMTEQIREIGADAIPLLAIFTSYYEELRARVGKEYANDLFTSAVATVIAKYSVNLDEAITLNKEVNQTLIELDKEVNENAFPEIPSGKVPVSKNTGQSKSRTVTNRGTTTKNNTPTRTNTDKRKD